LSQISNKGRVHSFWGEEPVLHSVLVNLRVEPTRS